MNTESLLESYLYKSIRLCESKTSPPRLISAIHHAVFPGGARIRPRLSLAVSEACENDELDFALAVACSVEFLHCASLVHDDLPAMDDDNMRRGKPTVHVKWDEATAILVGDCLQAFAYEILCRDSTHPDTAIRIKLVKNLTVAAGFNGMVLGQVKDLEAEKASNKLSFEESLELQKLKTGALFKWSVESSCILAKANSTALCKYAL